MVVMPSEIQTLLFGNSQPASQSPCMKVSGQGQIGRVNREDLLPVDALPFLFGFYWHKCI